MTGKLVNYALYQAGWLCCVLGAANGRPWLGTFAALALVLVHLALLRERIDEIKILLFAATVGAVADSLQTCAGLLVFPSGSIAACIAPPWIVVMWIQFATLFRFALSFVLGRYALGALLAAVGGPLAFWAGSRVGAVEFPPPQIRSLLVIAAVWAAAFPALLWFAGRYVRAPGRYGRRTT